MKKLTIYFSLILTLLLITGCIRRDDLENIKITTTIEPITYLTYELYGDYAEIESIYGNDSEKLEINNEKILENIKQSRIFIYNGLNELETNLTKTLVQEGYHKKITFINASQNIGNTGETYDAYFWIDPANVLVLAENIRSKLTSIMTNPYKIKEIDEKFKTIQLTFSELDVKYREMINNSSKKTIITTSNRFDALARYNLEVVSIEYLETLTDVKYEKMINSLKEKNINYILIESDKEKENEFVKKVQNDLNAKYSYLYSVELLSETQVEESEKFIDIINKNFNTLNEILN